LGVLPVLGADVDIELLGLDWLLFFVFLKHVDWANANDSSHLLLAVDFDAEGGENAVVDSSDLDELEEAVLVDVSDHYSDLVHVGSYHNRRFFAFFVADNVSERVRADRVDVLLELARDNFLDIVLAARVSVCVAQLFEKVFHDYF